MTLTPVKGSRETTNKALLDTAIKNAPSLLIDCSRAANPYSIKGYAPEDMRNVHVIEVEMLYKFRDTIRDLPRFLHETNAETIVVTDTTTLFDYDNDEENTVIRRNAGKRLRRLAQEHTVYVANPAKNDLAPTTSTSDSH